MRYVLDTCVVVAALRSRRGASNRLLRMVFLRRIPVVIHYKLVAEYQAVLRRDAHRGRIGLTMAELDRFIAALIGSAKEVEVRYLLRPNLADENDNFVYEIAFAASPCTIVTHNVREFSAPELRWPGVTAKTPASVLQEVESHA